MDRPEQICKAAALMLVAEFLEHQPSNLLRAGHAPAVRDLAPNDQRAAGSRHGWRRESPAFRKRAESATSCPPARSALTRASACAVSATSAAPKKSIFPQATGSDEKARRQIAPDPKVLDKGWIFVIAGGVDQRQRRLHAGIFGDTLGAGWAHQGKHQRRSLQCIAELYKQQMPAVRRQSPLREQGVAQRREITMTFGHAAEAECCNPRRRIVEQEQEHASAAPTSAIAADNDMERPGRLAITHWANRSPDATRSIRSASDSSGRPSQDQRGDFRLIGGERLDDLNRRIGGSSTARRQAPAAPSAKDRPAKASRPPRRHNDLQMKFPSRHRHAPTRRPRLPSANTSRPQPFQKIPDHHSAPPCVLPRSEPKGELVYEPFTMSVNRLARRLPSAYQTEGRREKARWLDCSSKNSKSAA